MRLLRFAATAMIAQAAMFASSSANAQVVYTYTGNDFQSVFAPGYTTSDKITGTLTLSSALPDSLTTLTDESALVTAYSFSDGVMSFDSGCCESGNQTAFQFMTDATGAITGWVVTLETNDNHTGDLTTEGGITSFDQSLVDGVKGGRNDGEPGVWALQTMTSPVPEPSSWTMLLLGFAGLCMLFRGQRKPRFARTLN